MTNQALFSPSPECISLQSAPAWYGVRTKSNSEKLTADLVGAKGYEAYLPLYRVRKRWSDRVVEKELPLFPGYLFCRLDPHQRLPILMTPGVVSIISSGKIPIPIPQVEIAAIRTAIESGFLVMPCPYLTEGQRVQVREGPLEGVEGILVRKKNELRIVLSVEMLQRSVSMEIDRESVVAI